MTAAIDANSACLADARGVGQVDTHTWWGAIEALLPVVDGACVHRAAPIAGFTAATPAIVAWRAAQVMAPAVGAQHDQTRRLLDDHGLRRSPRRVHPGAASRA